ncbi:hypothetical protein GCM10022281_03990 [Sphingomonas rosea]|uniref:Cell division protein FtsL n=2 Tax=Sphingomonas rosea TaxID=335605 RepID=A0ABP7TMB6_9SPHN
MVRGFREMGWVAAVATTALGCYMVSLKVASERASLESVQNKIVLAQRDIRVLQTEIGTRGRLEQLESWNVKVLALSAPKAQQFLEGEFQLATLTAPKKTLDPAAPVVLASAPAPEPRAAISAPARSDADTAPVGTASDLMHVASYRRELPAEPQKTVDKPKLAAPKAVKAADKPATAQAPATKTAAAPTTAPRSKPKPAAIDAKAKTVLADTKAKAPAKTAPKPTAKPTAQPKDTKARQ